MDARLSRSVPLLLAVPLLFAGAAVADPPAVLRLLTAAGLILGLGAAALRISRRLLPDLSAPSRAASSLVFAAAMIVVPATVLGHCGLLQPRLFLATEALLIASTLALRIPERSPAPTGAVAAVSEGVPKWLGRTEAAVLMTASAAAVLSFLAYAVQTELYAPPIKLDDPSYHLSAVAVWHRHHDLRMIKFDAGDQSTAFYPIGGELIDWALLAPLRDSDFLVRWSQLPFALGSLAAMAAIALHLGLSRRSTLLAALLYLTVGRAFPGLMFSAGNDHITAFYVLATVDAAFVFAASRAAGGAVYAGLALGLLIGTKYIGLLYALPLLALLLIAGLRRPIRIAPVASLCLSAAIAGGYTYLRNAWSVGNPVFPVPVTFLGLPGWAEVTLAVRRRLPDFQINVAQFLLVRTNYFGHLFRVTMLPAAVLAPMVSVLRPAEAWRKIVRTLVLSLPVIFFLQFLYGMHDHRDIRYFLAGIALAAVAFGWLLESVAEKLPLATPAVRGALACLIAYKFVHTDETSALQEAATAAILLGLASVGLAAWTRLRQGTSEHRLAFTVLACGIAVLAAAGLAGTLGRYQERKYRDDFLVEYLEEHAGEDGAGIAYVGGNRPYRLFGSRLQNRVEIVPLTGSVDHRFYHWGGSADFLFIPDRYQLWKKNLRQLEIGYVAVVLGDQQDPERHWMRRHPRDFELVFAVASMEVWRVRAGSALRSPHLPDPPLPKGEEGEKRTQHVVILVSPLSPRERGAGE